MPKRRLTDDHIDVSADTRSKKPRLGNPESNPTGTVQPQQANEDYTIGWICAITVEYVAAQRFLDAIHKAPEFVSPNDNNHYTLGRIKRHNVVIAVLPDGEYGTCSAASAATHMLNTFRNVRIGLMVGVGGGAPSERHDIRLGDIVVSAPRNGQGGVFQYDFGKSIQNQSFQHTRFLNQPPTVIRTAVKGLMARHEIGHQLQERINNVLEEYPRLRKKYQLPDSSHDRLYKTTVTHPLDNDTDCTEVCKDLSDLKLRDERDKDEDTPVIHYGLIASADQLMKDATLRDKLADEKDVLCFEMEAAGLMNHFPCLVVRGICDYSDTHKNKNWQGYAAMAAAAYAKDLLHEIHPNQVEAEKKVIDILEQLEPPIQETHKSVQLIASKQMQASIEKWLSSPDPSTNYNKALQQRQKGTGVWLLNSSPFQRWQTQQHSFLWLHGIPGCGKTILSSTIVDYLEKTYPDQLLLYFYFDFTDAGNQTLDNVIRSLISQLYDKRKDTQKLLDSLFSSCDNRRRQPTSESLCKVFLQMINQAQETYIVLDALDECRTRKGPLSEVLLAWIQSLLDHKQGNVHLLVTSRPEHDIELVLRKLAQSKEDIVQIQSDLIKDDIRSYVHTRVRTGDGLKRWRLRPDVLDEIQRVLMEKAQGMFRWAACQIDVLEECLDYRQLKKALKSLPTTLDETYRRILDTIPDEHKSYAVRILQFLTFSERPLSIKEIIDAITVNTEGGPYFDPSDRMPDHKEISRYCSSLVVVVSIESEDVLQLAHLSVKEYLTSNRVQSVLATEFQKVTASTSIAKVCLAYLLQFDQELQPEEVQIKFPLAKYSATFWMSFAAVGNGEEDSLMGLIERFFCFAGAPYKVCYDIYRPDEPSAIYRLAIASPLYYAALGGFRRTVQLLLAKNADVNAQGGAYGNAVYAASSKGHEQVVKLLLEKNANINVHSEYYGHAVCAGDYEQRRNFMIEKGADVNGQGGYYGNAVYAASSGGHEQVVKLLLEHSADVNAQGGYYGSALQVASSGGHEQVVKLLLEKNADVNAQSGYYGNALQAASSNGHEQVVELLLKKGARKTMLTRSKQLRALSRYEVELELILHLNKKRLLKSRT